MNTYSFIRKYLELRNEFPQKFRFGIKQIFNENFTEPKTEVKLYRAAPNDCEPIWSGVVDNRYVSDHASQAERLCQRKLRYDYFMNYEEKK